MLRVQFCPHENSEEGEETLVFKRRIIPQGSGTQVRRPNRQESDPSKWHTEGKKWQLSTQRSRHCRKGVTTHSCHC
eukprot:5255263-Amphidinium_carterae.1